MISESERALWRGGGGRQAGGHGERARVSFGVTKVAEKQHHSCACALLAKEAAAAAPPLHSLLQTAGLGAVDRGLCKYQTLKLYRRFSQFVSLNKQ